jgi:hypothetical protein
MTAATVTAQTDNADAVVRSDRSDRLAAIAFLTILALALVLYLIFGHSQWFFLDDWDFLADRNVRDPGDLFRPHNEHWSTMPILVYRVLWRLFGLRTYVPYQVIAVLLHLTAAALLRMVMRRAGVGPWIATVAAALFALFGAGDQNIVWAFQMAWGASLVLGLTQILLADHDGPIDRRDWLGLSAGLANILCSGVAVTMIVVVGLAAFVRRGWRAALFHTAPLGVLYLAWWLAFARDRYSTAGGSVDIVVRFVWAGLTKTFNELGQVPGVGIALAALLVAGLVPAWRGVERRELRRRAAAPAALLSGAVIFLAVAGLGRASVLGPELARSSRYLHIVAALSLPCIAVAADAFVRRGRLLGAVAIALVLVGIPGNIDLLVHHENRAKFLLGRRELVLALPRNRLVREVPRRLRPLPDAAPEVTIGWLLDAAADGQVPDPGRVNPVAAANATLRLSLLQSRRPRAFSRCRVLGRPVNRTLNEGHTIGIDGGRIQISPAQNPLVAVVYAPAEGHALVVLHGPLKVSIGSFTPAVPASSCP